MALSGWADYVYCPCKCTGAKGKGLWLKCMWCGEWTPEKPPSLADGLSTEEGDDA